MIAYGYKPYQTNGMLQRRRASLDKSELSLKLERWMTDDYLREVMWSFIRGDQMIAENVTRVPH